MLGIKFNLMAVTALKSFFNDLLLICANMLLCTYLMYLFRYEHNTKATMRILYTSILNTSTLDEENQLVHNVFL